MRWLKIAALFGAATVAAMIVHGGPTEGQPLAAAEAPSDTPEVVVAAQGRLEGQERTARVGAEIAGVVSKVLVSEGDQVESGQALARLRCPAAEAEIAGATARLAQAEAALRLLLRGAPDEARREAQAARAAAEERMARARQVAERQRELWREGADLISRDDLDRAEAEARVALAEWQSAKWRLAAVEAPPLPEARAVARARAATARAELEQARARRGRCTVRSPRSGTVVWRRVEPGESVGPLAGGALFEVADLSSWHVRAEIDEAELGWVRLGQPVVVSAEAFDGLSVGGEVVRVGQRMGPRRTLSDDPVERRDRNVLEVVVRLLDPPPVEAVGLRVVAKFLEPATS